MGVVKAALKQESVVGLVHEQLPCRLAVIESFGLVGVGGREDDKRNLVACVTRAAAVVFVIGSVKRVAGSQSATAPVVFRIRHRDKVARINRHEELEVVLLAVKFIGELSEKFLEGTSLGFVSDAESGTQSLEHATFLLVRCVGAGGEFLNCRNTIGVIIVRTGEEADSAVNEGAFLQVEIQRCRIQDRFCETANESVVGIVCLRPVDDDSLQVVVPSIGVGENVAQVALCVGTVLGEAVDESVANVVKHGRHARVAAVIGNRRPDVLSVQIDNFVHG